MKKIKVLRTFVQTKKTVVGIVSIFFVLAIVFIALNQMNPA